MSTKTSILKRIARVAVIALLGGTFTTVSVTQSQATPGDVARNVITAISTGSVASTNKIARVNEAYAVDIHLTTGSTGGAGLDARINAQFTAVPGGTRYNTAVGSSSFSSGSLTLVAGSLGSTTFLTAGSGSGSITQSTGTAPSFWQITTDDASETIKGSVSKGKLGTWTFVPDSAGVYKVLLWSDDATGGNAGVYDSGEVSTTVTVTVGTTPASIEIKAASSVAATTDSLTFAAGSTGGLFLVRLKDAAGNVTVPNSTESVTVSTNVGTLDDTSFTVSDFDPSGWAATNLKHTAAGIAVVTATPAGAIASIGAVSAQTTFTVADTQAASIEIDNSTGHDQTPDTAIASSGSVSFGTNQSSLTYRLRATLTAESVTAVQILDTSGVFTGRKNTTYTLPVTMDATDDYGTITITTSGFSTAGTVFALTADDSGGDVVLTHTSATPVVNATNSSISPTTAQAVTGGSLTLTATAKDQFKNLINSAVVAWSVSGRNTTSGVTTQKLTDANGISTYTVTDTSTSTTSLTDTVAAAFTYNGTTVAAGSVTSSTISWGANTVKTVEYTVTPTLDDAAATSAIYTGYAGASASGRVTLTVLVTGSNGLALAGVPVTFATSNAKTGVLVSSGIDYSTRYTGSDGKATTYVYGWTKGATTVTATAGAVAATTIINFTNAASDARYINTDIDGNIVKATVTDRFGNTVKGVTVNFTRTGGGYFGNGTTGTSGVTDTNGVVEVVVTPGATATVVTASLDTDTYTQAKDPASYVNLTAILSTGIGASFNTAGKASDTETVAAGTTPAVSAAEAAADAAAEAIDAANAATDAANLAAEAADAATVAAEEARDAADAATAAVEELATQVATLMAALKAQITTLANTVAKVAKKVKA